MSSAVKSNLKISFKIQSVTALLAAVAAVALPQLFHLLGLMSGTGTLSGEIFLPMHLPIILAGFLAGPLAGGAAGLAAPIISFMLSGMPGLSMLPFMAIELAAYGIFAGLLKNVRLPSVVKVFAVQIIGRAVRAASILTAFYALGSTAVKPAVILTSIAVGAPGIILQLVLIPLAVFRIENRAGNAE